MLQLRAAPSGIIEEGDGQTATPIFLITHLLDPSYTAMCDHTYILGLFLQ